MERELQTDRQSILLLGATGSVGRAVARLLLTETSHNLVLASRHAADCRKLAAELLAVPTSLPTTASPASRLAVREVDATDSKSLTEALDGVGTMIVAAPLASRIPAIARVALNRKVNWLDVLYPPRVAKLLAPFNAAVAAAGLTWVTQAGVHPGLPAALVRFVAQRGPALASVDLRLLMNLNDLGSVDSIAEVLREWVSTRVRAWENGAWKNVTVPRARAIDFGRFGRRACVPMELPELEALPSELKLDHMAAWASGFNGVTDYVVMPVGLLLTRLAPRMGARLAARCLSWAAQMFASPPFGVVLQADCTTREGEVVRLRVEHADAYAFAAASTVGCLSQMLDGTVSHVGIRPMGACVDPAELIADLRRLGCAVEQKRTAQAAPARANPAVQ
ncbi:MAG: saccharopine dehydrogenase NADP-binding domain-containing protein [Tepidisphaeraceae bacterium]